ncbi:hypothetical protein GCM10027343_34350 [Noviherbaspirillum agri]
MRKHFTDILQAGMPGMPYDTSSLPLPVGSTAPPCDALEKQDELRHYMTELFPVWRHAGLRQYAR